MGWRFRVLNLALGGLGFAGLRLKRFGFRGFGRRV